MLKYAKTIAVGLILLMVSQAEVSAQDKKVHIVQSTSGLAYIVAFVAQGMGYFKDAGLETDLTYTGNALAAILNGDAQVSIGSTVSSLNANARGVGVVLFAALSNQYGNDIIITKDYAAKHNITASTPIDQKLKALRGMRVGVSGTGSGSEQLVHFLARTAGLDPERDVTIVPLGDPSARLLAFRHGQVDALSIATPVTQLLIKDYAGQVFFDPTRGEVSSIDGYFQIGVSARVDWLKQNPETAAKVTAALKRAIDTLRDPVLNVKARDVVHSLYHKDIDPSLYADAWSSETRRVAPGVKIDDAMMMKVVDFNNTISDRKIDKSLIPKAYTNEYTK